MVAGLLEVSLDDLLTDGREGVSSANAVSPASVGGAGLPDAPTDGGYLGASVLAGLKVISEREAQLLNWYRMSTEQSKDLIETVARTTEKLPLAAIVDDKSKRGAPGA